MSQMEAAILEMGKFLHEETAEPTQALTSAFFLASLSNVRSRGACSFVFCKFCF